MSGPPSTAVRIERARHVVAGLHADLGAWLDRLAAKDPAGRHASHRAVLARLGAQAAQLLSGGLPEQTAATPAVHRACRAAEGKAAAVRRVWEVFRPMLDQRLHGPRAGLLAAADEVVWSCVGGEVRPAPIACLDARATPDAFPVELFPQRRDLTVGPLLEALDALVLPFVRLPVDTAPWGLLPLAHEVGHHLQFAGAPDRAWIGALRERLRAIGGDTWARWGEEIFADLFAVCALGPYALEVLADFVLDTPAAMQAGSRRYPPATTRLALMAACWEALGRDGDGWAWRAQDHLGGVDPALVVLDDRARAVVKAALEPLPGGAGLDGLTPFATDRLHPEGDAQRGWISALLGAGPLPIPVEPDVLDARVAACAARAAFARLPAPGDPAREAARAALFDRAAAAIAGCSPEGERAPQALPDFTAALSAVDA